MLGGVEEIHEEHEEHVNHEAWVIPYADLLTLLMAMFIALFAMSTVDITKFKAFAIGFNEALGGGKLDAGIGGTGKATSPVVGQGNGSGPFSGGTLMPSDTNVSQAAIENVLSAIAGNKALKSQQQQQLSDLKSQIDEAAKAHGFGNAIHTRQLNNGLEVTLLTDEVLFASGQADLQLGGERLLQVIAQVLTGIDNHILIRGYTDSRPIHTIEFPSNLRLSGARAGAVEDYLVSLGLDPNRFDASGRGALDPIGDNRTDAGRALNRRVEIIVQSKLVEAVQDQAGLNDQPVDTTPTTRAIQAPASPSVGGAVPNLSPNLGAG